MARRAYFPAPTWDGTTLEAARRAAIEDFIAERSAEGSAPYRAAFRANLTLVTAPLEQTNDLLALGTGQALARNPGMLRVARYLGGPPVSADDLDTLADARIAGRRRLSTDLAQRAARVLVQALDPERFPWLFASPPRSPTPSERRLAVRWTAGLQAAQEVQTGRRGESSVRQQQAVERLLEQTGFARVPPRPVQVTGGLAPGEFCREVLVAGIKCDVPVGLRDGRFLLLECKVSNSATNSVKRLNREVGGKANEWRRRFGERAVTGTVLAGVFKAKNLFDAQEAGVVIFWEHDLTPLVSFLTQSA